MGFKAFIEYIIGMLHGGFSSGNFVNAVYQQKTAAAHGGDPGENRVLEIRIDAGVHKGSSGERNDGCVGKLRGIPGNEQLGCAVSFRVAAVEIQISVGIVGAGRKLGYYTFAERIQNHHLFKY